MSTIELTVSSGEDLSPNLGGIKRYAILQVHPTQCLDINDWHSEIKSDANGFNTYRTWFGKVSITPDIRQVLNTLPQDGTMGDYTYILASETPVMETDCKDEALQFISRAANATSMAVYDVGTDTFIGKAK